MNILTSQTVDKGNTPKDIITIRKFLDSFGIEEYEKNTLNFLSEFLNTYITDLLNEAKKNMQCANRNKINIEDVKLAVKVKQDNLYKTKPNISALRSMMRAVNEMPLPNIPDSPHVLLPPIDNNLLRNNFQIYSEELYQQCSTMINNRTTNLRPDDMMLGLKRKDDQVSELKSKKRIKLSMDNNPPHKHRKLSLTQAYKPKEKKEEKEEKEEENEEEDNDNGDENMEEAGEDNEGADDGEDPFAEKDDEDNYTNQGKESTNKHKESNDNLEPFHNEEDEEDLNEFDFQ